MGADYYVSPKGICIISKDMEQFREVIVAFSKIAQAVVEQLQPWVEMFRELAKQHEFLLYEQFVNENPPRFIHKKFPVIKSMVKKSQTYYYKTKIYRIRSHCRK